MNELQRSMNAAFED
jgi:hypothetical protein